MLARPWGKARPVVGHPDAQARLDLERVRSAKLEAELCQLRRLAEDRRRLFGALADARADIARLRQVLIDIEDPTRGYLAWRPTLTKSPNFHVPSKFGNFRFVS